MENFYNIITTVNNIVLVAFSIAFLFQIIYILLFFVPLKKYKSSQRSHKIAVIIPAHNEEEVIYSTVQNILKQKYPRQFYTIYVVADNCTDNTAKYAERAGAHVIIHTSAQGEKRNAGTAVAYAVNYVLQTDPEVEFFVRFDADNIPHPDYLSKMNDAFECGAKAAKGYNSSLNFRQNTVAGISAMWYIRDNAFTCRARSFLHISQMMSGGGMMFSAEIVKDGFNCFSNSEDAQFSLKLARKRVRAHYVSEAIVYEDQPSTIKDLFKRNMRMGGGLMRLFFTDGIKSFFKFFISFNYSLVDLFLSLIFIPMAVIGVIWFPFYYIYSLSYLLAIANYAAAIEILKVIGIILLAAFLLPFILQAMLAYAVERKKIGIPFIKLLPVFLLFPLHMIIYALGITLGALGFNSWNISKRNDYYDESFISAFEASCGEKPELRGGNINVSETD